MRFEGFYGNGQAKRQLSGAFDSGRVPHALLLDGPAGSGRKMLARIIAQAAVCEGAGEKPCGRCRQCHNALSGNHPDILTFSGAGGVRSFSVDTVRRMRLDSAVGPNDAEKKVYLLTDVQNMTEQAQNAILKILEEPPAYILFVLTCDGLSRVLPTVRSRCEAVSLGPVSETEAVEALLKAEPGIGREDAVHAARLSGYLIGRALKGLSDGSFVQAARFCGEFTRALCGSSQYSFLRLSGALEKDGELFDAFLSLAPLLIRDAVAVREETPARLSGCEEEAGRLAETFTLHTLYSLAQATLDMQLAAQRYANKTLLLTGMFARFWHCAHSPLL